MADPDVLFQLDAESIPTRALMNRTGAAKGSSAGLRPEGVADLVVLKKLGEFHAALDELEIDPFGFIGHGGC